MKITAVVVSTQNNTISVTPLKKAGCASCTAECGHKSNSFVTANPFNLPVKTGDIVMIENSRKTQALQGIFSLVFPVASAVAGYFLMPKIAHLFGKESGDGFRAIGVLAFLLLASLIVYISSRTFLPPERPQISSIVNSQILPDTFCEDKK
ncbi:MAG: SoxR reducing system RseC family protein [Treponema sp.]|nr:SoxR reducing system RseC family protein [Treponema sp.]